MQLAQTVVSLVRSMRERSSLKVRQPLGRISIPANDQTRTLVEGARDIILDEINVKDLEFVEQDSPLVQKSTTPNFRRLGPRFGKTVNQVAARIRQMTQKEIAEYEKTGRLDLEIDSSTVMLEEGDLATTAKDIEGWMVESADGLTVALDTTLTPALVEEGIAREFVNRVQNMRKDAGFEVTDRIHLGYSAGRRVTVAIENMSGYVQTETLALSLEKSTEGHQHQFQFEINEEVCKIGISKAA